MSLYTIGSVPSGNRRAQREVNELLKREGIRRVTRVDETIGIYDADHHLIASGGLLANTIRGIAVDGTRRGEGLTALLMQTLLKRQAERGYTHVFLYARPHNARVYENHGFHEILQVEGLSFMENVADGFDSYLRGLQKHRRDGARAAGVVLSANPFTLGHQHLLEAACAENDVVHCFVVSHESSLIPAAARLALTQAGSAHLPDVAVHPTGGYIIPIPMFPACLFPDERSAVQAQARLDVEIFTRVARAVGITRRYIGEEPYSRMTRSYNRVLRTWLPRGGIQCEQIPRREVDGSAISATQVRRLLHEGAVDSIQPLVPPETYAYFTSEDGRGTLSAIQAVRNARHI